MSESRRITAESYDRALHSVLHSLSAADMLQIDGVYRLLMEHYRNEVIDLLNSERQFEEEHK